MQILPLLFLLFSQSSLAVASDQTELGGAGLGKDSEWINAPKEVAPAVRVLGSASAGFGVRVSLG